MRQRLRLKTINCVVIAVGLELTLYCQRGNVPNQSHKNPPEPEHRSTPSLIWINLPIRSGSWVRCPVKRMPPLFSIYSLTCRKLLDSRLRVQFPSEDDDFVMSLTIVARQQSPLNHFLHFLSLKLNFQLTSFGLFCKAGGHVTPAWISLL